MNAEKIAVWGARIAEENRAWLARAPATSEVELDERLARIRAEMARRHRAARVAATRARWALGLAAAVAMIAALFLFIPRGEVSRELRATARGAAVHPGDRLVARSEPLGVAFDDGSHVELASGSEAEIAELDGRTVRVRLLGGAAKVRVVHREGRTWWLRAGEHAIEVVGTEFTVRYDPASASLDVDLREGRVRVVGACADPSVIHRGPVRFTAGCSPIDRPAPSASGASPAAPPPTASATSSASGSATAGVEPWRSARERGDLRAAFELASESGLDGVAAKASAGELVDLALGARLAGSRREAVRLYELTRSRFGGTDAAATSAFHLGRLAFDEAGAWADAERWFSTYLAERPGGALAAESLGRSMEAAERQGATDRARGHAAAYLARFPDGPLAGRARKLVDAGDPPQEPPRLPP